MTQDYSAECKFMWAVQALALPADQQVLLYPDFADVTDELALEHEETQADFLRLPSSSVLTMQQLSAIRALDAQMEQMSHSEDRANLWTLNALMNRAEWEDVRLCARAVLDALGWAATIPPMYRGSEYVGATV